MDQFDKQAHRPLAKETQEPAIEQVPTDFLSFLASTKQNEFESLYDFALDTLTFSNKVNIYHWTCEQGFVHTVMEDIYEMLRSFADDLVEVVMSKDVKFKINNKQYTMTDQIYDKTNVITKITEYRDEANRISEFFKQDRGITPLFDNLISGLDKQLGLLKSFN